ncbi:DUF7527 domain-containing protein [Haloplanus litoreus]|uniref:DUF7527 domain-containing protein n=2 Tax=Haloplanus litoreus TaxID=767515 RepID=A0ABD6A3A1_9EURY
MDGEILDAVTEWGTRPVADGVTGLYDLVDEEFSGAVTDGTAWAFVLNGRYLGVFDGDIEDFEDTSLTAYTAPDISLPLLYAMQARGGQTRGQYYSNETSLAEIDETLSSGSFVGYVELSENVLSGDYYVVYYGGRSLPVAYVGNSRRLLTGDEAFERAADEVGIYSVVDADVEVVDLPERPEPAPTDVAAAGSAVAGDDAGTDLADAEDEDEGVGDVAFDDDETDDGTDATGGGADDDGTDATGGVAAAGPATAEDGQSADDAGTTPDWATPDVVQSTESAESTAAEGDGSEAAATDVAGTDVDADAETAAPDETASTVDGADAATTDEVVDSADEVATDDAEVSSDAEASRGSASDDEIDRLRQELDAARAAEEEAEAARDRIASERDDYRVEVERLRERVAELEAKIERLEAGEADADAAPERTLAPAEALSGTNLFVRYEDKTGGTLERAAEGRIDESTLRDNLRIDYHTEFETAGLSVDGQQFEAFLRGTPEHRFAEWLLTAVTYEIRQTDTRAELTKLYEAIERVDRIDLDGTVDVATDGERDDATAVSFDVVFRDKMGDPLFVAAFEDSRDPTSASAIESLLDRSRRVSETDESLAAAFFVTTSFFGADAMEVAVDATRGGLFSRSSRRSYVKLSRKSGFHLCLVEARDEDFFLTVPDL